MMCNQINDVHGANKTTKEIAETIKIGLRTVQWIFKTLKENGEPSSSGKKCENGNVIDIDLPGTAGENSSVKGSIQYIYIIHWN